MEKEAMDGAQKKVQLKGQNIVYVDESGLSDGPHGCTEMDTAS